MKPGKIVAFPRSMILVVGLTAALSSERDCILSAEITTTGWSIMRPDVGSKRRPARIMTTCAAVCAVAEKPAE